MKRFLKILLSDDRGQDLVEYTLLVAFVALTSAGLFVGSGANVAQSWSSANSILTAGANKQNPPSTSSGSGGTDPGGGHWGDGGHDGGRH
ncbi:MAG TPA: hypothetical protein VMG35_24100 [Bryobacteraceae bacterium]|nr:hypothetical protein [Bryobacteraceae bacterium]